MIKSFIIILFIGVTFTSDAYSQLVPDFRVNDDTTHNSNTDGKLGFSNEGNFTVVWEDYRRFESGVQIGVNVFCQRYDRKAIPIGGNFVINDHLDSSGSPDVAVHPNGTFGVCWLSLNNNVRKITTKLFDSSANSISSEIVLNDSTSQFLYPPIISTYSGGGYIIVWRHRIGGKVSDKIFFQIIDSLGAKIGGNVVVNEFFEENLASNPDIATLPDGRFIITWQDTRPPASPGVYNIYMQMFDKSGTKIGSNIRVSDDSTGSNYSFPYIASDTSGRFCIGFSRLYFNGNEGRFQLFNNDGTKNGSNLPVLGPGEEFIRSVSKKDDGRILIGYNINGVSFYQRVDTNGVLIGNYYLMASNLPLSPKYVTDTKIYNDNVISIWIDELTGDFNIYCNVRSYNNPDSTVGINQISNEVPEEFKLYQNYPNPFNPTTNIKFKIPRQVRDDNIKLIVFDVIGREAAVLVNEKLSPGEYEYKFDGSAFGSGVYFYRFEAGEFQETRRMVLVK